MKFNLPLVFSAALLLGCAGKKEVLDVPEDMPEICRGIDFVANPDMRDVCGVRASRYQSYKNVPQQRYLIVPKGASVVLKKKKLELRLPNTLPVDLPKELRKKITFNQEARLEYIKNKMVYKELYPEGMDRIKMFKLNIPLNDGTSEELCFNVPEKQKTSRRKTTRMGNKIESLSCEDFDDIVQRYGG
jgi:hypothetical protein